MKTFIFGFIIAFLFTLQSNAQTVKEAISFKVGDVELKGEIKRPRDIDSATRLPLVLLFGGFEEAGKVLDLIRSPIPCAVASFDYPFDASRKLKFPKSLGLAAEAKRALHLTNDGIPKFLDAIIDKGYVDPNKITIAGASFGAPFAVYAAAEDARFTGVAIIHGFADVPEVIEHRLSMAFEEKYPSWIGSSLALVLSRSLWWYAGAPNIEEAAKKLRSSQKVYVVSAKEDSFVPTEASELLWKSVRNSAAGKNAKRDFTSGEHLHPGKPQLISKLLEMTLVWMNRQNLL